MRTIFHNIHSLVLTVLPFALNSLCTAPAEAGAFVELVSKSAPRFLPTATRLSNGQVLLAGGGGDPIFQNLASAEIYDPSTHARSPAGSMSTPRVADSAVLFPRGSFAAHANNEPICTFRR